MNRYTADQTAIIDSLGRVWQLETWHPLPLPEGVCYVQMNLLFNGEASVPTSTCGPLDTHWLARKPLPPLPKPKTQAELDEDAYHKYMEATRTPMLHAFGIWNAAIAYARNSNPSGK